MATESNTRIWGLIALLAGLAIGLSYGLDWLGLSVDGIVRDDVLINDVAIAGGDLSTGIVALVLGGVVALCGLVFMLRPGVTRTLGWLTAIGGLLAIGYAAYIYLTRDDVLTGIAVDRVASDDVPAETVERAVDLALRGGVDVLPQAGLILAAVGGLVALAAGILLTRRVDVVAAPVSSGEAVLRDAPIQPKLEPMPEAADEAASSEPVPQPAPVSEPDASGTASPGEPALAPKPAGESSGQDRPPDDTSMWRI